MMECVGKRVMHKVFGEGNIVKQGVQHIYVQFTAKADPVVFAVPNAFGKYLQLVDTDAAPVAVETFTQDAQE